MKEVIFRNNSIEMSGILYFPENMDETKKYPAIVCSHPSGKVKEQTAGLYSELLSKKGFVVLAFDATYQGESGGEPRMMEDPFSRVEDIRVSIDYLTTIPFIDIDRIGAMGICGGGGYTVSAAQTERRIKAVATVSGSDAGSAARDGWLGGNSVEVQINMLNAIAAQRTAEANGKKTITMYQAYEPFKTPRGQYPISVSKLLFSKMDKLFSFSATAFIDTLLTQPLLLIAGSKAESLHFSQEMYHLANCDKELFIMDGATQDDLYDKMEFIEPTIEKLTTFFRTKL